MEEYRYQRFSRNLANLTIHHIESMGFDEKKKRDYLCRFIKEVEDFSFEPRPKGTPRNKGCVWELEDIVNVDFNNPEEYAKLMKENFHYEYLKPTQERNIGLYLKIIKEHYNLNNN